MLFDPPRPNNTALSRRSMGIIKKIESEHCPIVDSATETLFSSFCENAYDTSRLSHRPLHPDSRSCHSIFDARARRPASPNRLRRPLKIFRWMNEM